MRTTTTTIATNTRRITALVGVLLVCVSGAGMASAVVLGAQAGVQGSPAGVQGAPARVQGAPAASAAHARYTVIGCDDRRLHFENRAALRYAPRNCETGGSLGSSEGIAAVRWRDWGAARASGTGQLIDGLGFAYPATITAYDLVRGARSGSGRQASWYRRLHVVAGRQFRGEVFRGPFDVVIDVEPRGHVR